jgi:hypothetical protein
MIAVLLGCGEADDAPVSATAWLTLDRLEVPFDGPLKMAYGFMVMEGAPVLEEGYRVFVHFRNLDGELLWEDDHELPVPVDQWVPGKTVNYTRTIFLPRLPYLGTVDVEMGVFSPVTGERLRLATRGSSVSGRAYRLATFDIRAQTNPAEFSDGWHGLEGGRGISSEEWRWSTSQTLLTFVNPEADAVLYLDIDQPVALSFPQQVEVHVGEILVDEFDLPAGRVLREIDLRREVLGDAFTAEVRIAVDRVFVPREIEGLGSNDTRSLGVRVFHAVLLSSVLQR